MKGLELLVQKKNICHSSRCDVVSRRISRDLRKRMASTGWKLSRSSAFMEIGGRLDPTLRLELWLTLSASASMAPPYGFFLPLLDEG